MKYLSICLSDFVLSFYPFVVLPVILPLSILSFYLSFYLCPIRLSFFVYICLSFYLYPMSVVLSICLDICFICHSIYICRSISVCFSLCQTAYGMYPLSDVACFSSMLCSHSHKCPILSGSLSDWCWL